MISSAKNAHYDKIISKIEGLGGEQFVYQLMKLRQRQALDVEKFHGVNDEQGHFLTNRRQVLDRWRGHYKQMSTKEFPHPKIPRLKRTQGPVQQITTEEVERALRKMNSGKATGPDDLAAELWKSQRWTPAQWLAQLFNKIIEERKIPEDWRRSTTVPIWKGKGNPADCAS